MMSTPSFSCLACFSRSVPPYTVIIFKPDFPPIFSISIETWLANSLVGAKISACNLPVGWQDSIIGIPNAPVLPEPVLA